MKSHTSLEKSGTLVTESCCASYVKMQKDADRRDDVLVGSILETSYNCGDLVAIDIIDPTVRTALQDAASLAGLLITTEALVTKKPKKEAPPPPAPPMDY